MESLWQDFRSSLRKIMRRPIFSAVVVLCMALGIGASAIVYGVVRGALLKPFDYPELERLGVIWVDLPQLGTRREVISVPEYLAVAELDEIFAARGTAIGSSYNLTGEGDPERFRGLSATPGLFPTLGVKPHRGRWLLPADAEDGAPPVVLVSYDLWQNRFGGDPDLVGRNIHLNEQPSTVVGIMPPRFHFGRAEIWSPLSLASMGRYHRSQRLLWTIVRLREGVSRERANAALEVLARQLEQEYAGEAPEYEDWQIAVEPLREYFVGEVKAGLFMLSGTVAFVLLVVCANVANLLLARAFSREREIATRLAVGAGRGRIVSLLLSESMLLVMVGGAFGLLFTFWGLDVVASMIPQQYLPTAAWFGIDRSALAFIAGVTLLSGLLVGSFPAFGTSRPNLQESLKEGGRAAAAGRRGRFLLNALVVVEVAAALVLLVGFGLMLRGFVKLQRADTGFVADEVLSFHIVLPFVRYREAHQVTGFFGELIDRLEAIPGVEAAGGTRMLPLEEYIAPRRPLTLEGRAEASGGAGLDTVFLPSTSGYFRAMRIPLESGRLFTRRDDDRSQPVAVVNQAFADRFFPDAEPLGKRLQIGPPEAGEPWRTIVGVVRDVTQRRLTETIEPAVYAPFFQPPESGQFPFLRMTVRSSVEPTVLVRAIRGEVRALEPNLPIFNLETVSETVAEALGGWRLCVLLLTGFAVVALLLSALGLYGVISYAVSQRTHEIGVRMAMGAGRRDILRMVLGRGLALALCGVLIGAIPACLLTRYLATLTLEIPTAEPLVYGGVTVFLLGVTLLVCSIPAWQASRVSAAKALRAE